MTKTVLVALTPEQIEFLQNMKQEFEHLLNTEVLGRNMMRPVNHTAVETLKEICTAIESPVSPSVVLGMEGDWVQGATANMPIDIVLIDHDRDENDPDRAREIPVLVDPEGHDELLDDENMLNTDNSAFDRSRP